MSTYGYGANIPVWELVRGRAGRARVLEGFGIDYCCGGRTPLKEACAERGLNVEEVLRSGSERRCPTRR